MSESTLLSPKYRLAVDIVADLFRDVRRHITDLPYIVHLVGVSHIVAKVTDDEDVHIAALLHDVLEDIPSNIYSEADMRRDFGNRITDIVKTVSHDEINYSKDEARQKYLNQISSGSVEACIVSAADLLFNTTDIVDTYRETPEKVIKKFGGESAKRREWFWNERYQILLKRLGADHAIIRELKQPLEALKAIHTEIM